MCLRVCVSVNMRVRENEYVKFIYMCVSGRVRVRVRVSVRVGISAFRD